MRVETSEEMRDEGGAVCFRAKTIHNARRNAARDDRRRKMEKKKAKDDDVIGYWRS
jgi:hypothetical protein